MFLVIPKKCIFFFETTFCLVTCYCSMCDRIMSLQGLQGLFFYRMQECNLTVDFGGGFLERGTEGNVINLKREISELSFSKNSSYCIAYTDCI